MADSRPSPSYSRRRRLAWMVGLNLAGIIFLLAAGEIFFRLRATYITIQDDQYVHSLQVLDSSPDLLVRETPRGKRLRPNVHLTIRNHRLSHTDIDIDTNSYGFRDREPARIKPPGGLRIMVLGDSITMADYLPDDQTWVERTEQELSRQFPERTVEVINAGIADVGTREEIDLLEDTVDSLKPTWVILAFYLNDARPPWGFPGELGSYGWLRRHSILAQKVYEALAMLRFVNDRGGVRLWSPIEDQWVDWKTKPAAFQDLIQRARYDWGSAWRDESWTAIDGQLDRLLQLSRKYGFRVMVVTFPVRFQVEADFFNDVPQRKMASRAAQRNFAYLDLLPIFRLYRDRDDLFYDQCHPRPFLNRVAGRAVARAIWENIPRAEEPPVNKNPVPVYNKGENSKPKPEPDAVGGKK